MVVTFSLLVGAPALPYYFLAAHMDSAITALLMAYTLFYASLVSSIILYRISPMHPLSNYPGPFAMKISKLVWTYYASTGKQYRVFKDLHDKYGHVVRIGTTIFL